MSAHYAFVHCHGDSIPGQQRCGLVGLSYSEYLHQLSKPDHGWFCVNCGSSADYADKESEEAQENYDPTPYCSAGHQSEKDCDCGPIAENE